MKKLFVLAFLFAIVVSSTYATVGQNNKQIVGEWKYEVPTAPYGYEKGTLAITEKEGKLVGEVKFADGYKIELKNITYAESTFKCGLYVDYEYVSIKAAVDGNNMKGAVDTPEGEMKITAEKVK